MFRDDPAGSVYMDVLQRQLQPQYVPGDRRRAHFLPQYCRHLALSNTLKGHNGCVNCLTWNEDGTLLASGSDDRKVMLWSFPQERRRSLCLNTAHDLNIFGVEFMPHSASTKLVTCAYDRTVQIHNLSRTSSSYTYTSNLINGTPPLVTPQTTVFSNHAESVKDVAVEVGNAHCFWSAAEDGRVHQFDLRCGDVAEPTAPNMLIKSPVATDLGTQVEFKSLDINRVRPWLMATACSDRWVRVYDRRKLSMHAPTHSASTDALLSLAPLHLLMQGVAQDGGPYTTSAAFSNRGDKLVATYHGEQVYTFDVTKADRPAAMTYCCTRPDMRSLEAAAAKDDREGPYNCEWHEVSLKGTSVCLRSEANQCVFRNDWGKALEWYNRLLRAEPWLAQGYAARAIVLLHRGWRGDAMAALRDADTCVALSPNYPKAYETRVRCLQHLRQYKTAIAELDLLFEDFPEEARSRSLQDLRSNLAQLEAQRREAPRNRASLAHLPGPAPLSHPVRADLTGAQSLPTNSSQTPGRMFRGHLQYGRRSVAPDMGLYSHVSFGDDNGAVPRHSLTRASSTHAAGAGIAASLSVPSTSGSPRSHRCSLTPGSPLTSPRDRDRSTGDRPSASSSAGYAMHGRRSTQTSLEVPDSLLAGDWPTFNGGATGDGGGGRRGARGPDSLGAAHRRATADSYDASTSTPRQWDACPNAVPRFRESLRSSWSSWTGANGSTAGPCRPSWADAAPDAFAASGAAAGGGERQSAFNRGVWEPGGNPRHTAQEIVGAMSEILEEPSSLDALDARTLPGTATPDRVDSDAMLSDSTGLQDTSSSSAAAAATVAAAVAERSARALESAHRERSGGSASAPLASPSSGAAAQSRGRVGAVVESDDPPMRGDADTGMLVDEELCSYVYGHRDWNEPDAGNWRKMPYLPDISTAAGLERAVAHSMRTLNRYVGHCNMRTDIKKAIFVGGNDSVIACGSDGGQVLLFDADSGQLLRILWADSEVANCVACHPSMPVLATSGLEDVVRLWELDWSRAECTQPGAAAEDIVDTVQRHQNDMANMLFTFHHLHANLHANVDLTTAHAEIMNLIGYAQPGAQGPQCATT